MLFKSKSVSVIITCYNYGHFLEDCLKSVLTQSYSSLDIILVDDGSTDSTHAIANKYRKKVRYIYQENQGLSAARNTGIKYIKGDYVLFLDADDLLGRTSITRRVNYLIRNPSVDIAICRNYLFSDKQKVRRQYNLWRLPRGELSIAFMHFNIAPPHAYLLRVETIKGEVFFDTSLKACEDYDFWLGLLKNGWRFGVSGGHVFYRKHEGSMSSNLVSQWRHDLIMHIRVYELFFMALDNINQACICNLLAYLSGTYITLSRLKDDVDISLKCKITTYSEKLVAIIISGNWMLDPKDVHLFHRYFNLVKPSMTEATIKNISIRVNTIKLGWKFRVIFQMRNVRKIILLRGKALSHLGQRALQK